MRGSLQWNRCDGEIRKTEVLIIGSQMDLLERSWRERLASPRQAWSWQRNSVQHIRKVPILV